METEATPETSTEDMGEKITTWKTESHQGRGHRHRGMAKKAGNYFLDAEDILFFPLEIEKRNSKFSIQRWELHAYLREYSMRPLKRKILSH